MRSRGFWVYLTGCAGIIGVILAIAWNVGCDDFAGAESPTLVQLEAIRATVDSWAPLPSLARCAGHANAVRVLTESDSEVNILCGSSAFACYISSANVIVLRASLVGTRSEQTLMIHETVHLLGECNLRNADGGHVRQDFWITSGVCLPYSVEGRARLTLNLGGCDTNPGSNCCE